jgi:hypothetical protein
MFPQPAQNLVVATSGVGEAHRVDVALERKAVLVDGVNALHVSARRFKYFRVVRAIRLSVPAVQHGLCTGFDSRQLH